MDAFLDAVGNRTPTPGGGSVAALVAVLAISMAKMVTAYSIRKQSSETENQPLTQFAAQLDRMDHALRRLIDEDANAYQNLVEVRQRLKQPGEDPAVLQEAIRLAVAVPLEVLALCTHMLQQMDEHKDRTNPHLRSDLAVTAHLGLAACRSAAETLWINAFDLDRQEDRAQVYDQSNRFLERTAQSADSLLTFVHES